MGLKCSLLLWMMQFVVFGKQLNLTQEALNVREQHRLAKKALKHDRTRKGDDVNGVRISKTEQNINLILQNKGVPKTTLPGSTTMRGDATSTSSHKNVNPITLLPKIILRRQDPTLAPTYPPIQPSHVTSQCVEHVNMSVR